jgi:hypothetical protein
MKDEHHFSESTARHLRESSHGGDADVVSSLLPSVRAQLGLGDSTITGGIAVPKLLAALQDAAEPMKRAAAAL